MLGSIKKAKNIDEELVWAKFFHWYVFVKSDLFFELWKYYLSVRKILIGCNTHLSRGSGSFWAAEQQLEDVVKFLRFELFEYKLDLNVSPVLA